MSSAHLKIGAVKENYFKLLRKTRECAMFPVQIPILFEANLMLVMRMIFCTNIHAGLKKLFLRLTLLSDQTRKHFKLYNRGCWLSTTVSSVLLRKKIADVKRQVW